jgi:membrane associated rhomboid family serine protease
VNRRFSFGLPPIRSTGAKLAVALVVGSLLGTTVLPQLGLYPGDALRNPLFLFQAISFSIVETTPMGVIFGALILWSIGGSIEQTWGTRKLLTFAFGVTIASGLLTIALALVLEKVGLMRFGGGTVMTSALWIAFGLMWGNRQTGFWGMPVTGNVLALIGVGFIILNAAFSSPYLIIPDALGAALTFVYVKLGFPDQVLERFNSWRLRRTLDKRRAHLNVVSGDKRNMPSDSDRFLH